MSSVRVVGRRARNVLLVRDARFTTKSGSVAQANHASAMSRSPLASKLERSAHLSERVNERALNRLGFKPSDALGSQHEEPTCIHMRRERN